MKTKQSKYTIMLLATGFVVMTIALYRILRDKFCPPPVSVSAVNDQRVNQAVGYMTFTG